MIQQRILNMLADLASKNNIDMHHKLAAAVVHRRNIIATGLNSYKTHPLMSRYGKNEHSVFMHAEVDAIKNALRLISVDDLAKCDLYVYRTKRHRTVENVPGLAKPCAGCMRAIETFGLRNVYYTQDNTLELAHLSRQSDYILLAA